MAQWTPGEEEFTEEEKVALGEVDASTQKEGNVEGQDNPDQPDKKDNLEKQDEPENKEGETEKKDEPDAATVKAIEGEGLKLINEHGKDYVVDEEGLKIPVGRWKQTYEETKAAKARETETTNKFNLFKTLGAEKYYEIYPNEKPTDFRPSTPKQEVKPVDVYSLRVQGGEYDGMTLREIQAADPVEATRLMNEYYDNQRHQEAAKRDMEAAEKKKKEDFDKAFDAERNSFMENVKKELFGKDSGYTKEEEQKAEAEYIELSTWMVKNGLTRYNLNHAYLIFRKDDILKRERIKASQKSLEKATDKTPKSISNGTADTGLNGYDNVMTMTEDQLSDHIDKMSDDKATKFYKEAPKELRAKYPDLPWG